MLRPVAAFALTAAFSVLLLLRASRPGDAFAALRAASAAPADGVPVRFEGHQVWRVAIASLTDLDRINTLQEQVPTLDFWTDPRIGRHGVDIRVAAAKGAQDSLAAFLNKFQLGYEVFIPDVQDAIDTQLYDNSKPHTIDKHQEPLILENSESAADPTKTYFTKYHPIGEINEYLTYLSTTYPDIVELFSLGETFEGRKQWGVHIRAPGSRKLAKKDKKEFVFFGGHHAREWIGPAVVQYILTELIVKYGKDKAITDAVDAFDFTIIPVLNVDGYEYTHSTNRMWRKNRQPNQGNACVGTDPNRNWDTNWGGDGSTSRNPCSDSYIGATPFSAPEPRNIANYLKERSGNVISFIDFHAYSQLWMYPFGSHCDVFADINVEKGAQLAAAALKSVHGKSFAVGSICKIIYQASGSSVDWAYEAANVTFSYALELRDQGLYGFLLPPKQIVPSGEETLAGVLEVVKFVKGYLKDHDSL
ncbi:hypothetical protein BDR26DRAFT_866669 [Obelidium mucronatum]|nr:hypothetical protein BDR26DRAFT_866669 [Obelidium mucronatum]